MIRRPPRSTQSRSSAASDVYKRQAFPPGRAGPGAAVPGADLPDAPPPLAPMFQMTSVFTDPEVSRALSLIHISEPTRLLSISYAVFCLKKKKKQSKITTDLYTTDHHTARNLMHSHR